MSDKDIIILIVWIMVGFGAWLLGYYYGVKTLQNRQKQMIKAIKVNNKIYTEWVESAQGTSWEDGYAQGIKNTLDTLNSFLERAK